MRYSLAFLALALAGAMLAGCGGLQKQVALAPEKTEQVVQMKASSFSFEPNNLKAYAGDTVDFKIENLSGRAHNLTMAAPGGETIKDVDLPAYETTDIKVTLTTAGTYEFYCNKPFHKSLGMKGQVVAVERK
jgi:plastocyanin